MNIYDCFMYFDEDLLLDVRLNILNKFVKKFVIVESAYLHSGKRKKLNFNINNYSKFKDKIIYLVVDSLPQGLKSINSNDDIAYKNKKILDNSLKRENLMEMHKVLTNPANASIIVVGDISVDEAEKLLNTEFQNWNSYENKININLPEVSSPQNSRVYLLNKPNAVQSYILAGQLLPPTNSGDDIVIDYMNYAIAGSFTSRLNMNLREDKSWSYGVRTGIGSALGQRLMQVRAPVQTDKTIESIQEILKEYNEYLTSNPITEEELDKAKKARTLRMPGNYETVGSLLNAVSGIVKYDRGLDYLDTLACNYCT